MSNIAKNLVDQNPMEVTEADSSPSAAMKHSIATTKASANAQTAANRSVGGGRKKKYNQRGGGEDEGITIPQAANTGGSSEAANAGLKQNFTAITQAGSNAKYDKPPQVGGRKKRRRTKRRKKSRRKHAGFPNFAAAAAKAKAKAATMANAAKAQGVVFAQKKNELKAKASATARHFSNEAQAAGKDLQYQAKIAKNKANTKISLAQGAAYQKMINMIPNNNNNNQQGGKRKRRRFSKKSSFFGGKRKSKKKRKTKRKRRKTRRKNRK